MTLIAAFRCREGAVLCADSQETVNGHKVTVTKIKPRQVGDFQLAIGGAGLSGDLIDAFEQRLIDVMPELHVGSVQRTTESNS